MYDTGVALTGLSCFVTPDLARDLANDIMTLVSHRMSCWFRKDRLSLTNGFILVVEGVILILKHGLLSRVPSTDVPH